MPSDRSQASAASQLLRQLLALSPTLGADLDRRCVAGRLVSAIAAVLPHDHVALHALVAEDAETTLASTGSSPTWTAAGLDPNSLVAQADSSEPEQSRGVAYEHPSGRRTLAVLPLAIDGRHQATLIVDREGDARLSLDEMSLIRQIVGEHDPFLDAAFAFHQLRLRGLTPERDRLTRAVQNGVAQELGALGLQVDMMRLAPSDERSTKIGLDDVRAEISAILGDLRSGVGRWSSVVPRPDTLGALICQRVQGQCAASGMLATITLHEDGEKLGPQVDSTVFACVQAVLSAAQLGGASEFIVEFVARNSGLELTARHMGSQWLAPIDAPPAGDELDVHLLPCGTGLWATSAGSAVPRVPVAQPGHA